MTHRPVLAAFCSRALAAIGLALGLTLGLAAPNPAHAQSAFTVDERGLLTMGPMLERVTPAVVNISVVSRRAARNSPLRDDPFFRKFLPDAPRNRQADSAGSGVVVDARRGYVLTNQHVIQDADTVVVTLRDGRNFEAQIIGGDPNTDIALLQIRADNLTAIEFGDSDNLRVGDVVLAIGNPFGLGQTVTWGIVSALGRAGLLPEGYEDFIQTDASINPGNSGGALITSDGRLVGINSAIIAPSGGNVGIGFAVPITIAKAVMDQLIESGQICRGWLGVSIQDVTPQQAQELGLRGARGAFIARVDRNGPAANAGIRDGDIIVEVNGSEIDDAAKLRTRIGLTPCGERARLVVFRNGRTLNETVTLGSLDGARPNRSAAAATGGARVDVAAFRGAEFASAQVSRDGAPGAVVTDVQSGSPADRLGLERGDVITRINFRPVADIGGFWELIATADNPIVLDVNRTGRSFRVEVRR